MCFSPSQKKANDPARFNNRGGNLLKEEKQRADLQKSLPKVRIYIELGGMKPLFNGHTVKCILCI